MPAAAAPVCILVLVRHTAKVRRLLLGADPNTTGAAGRNPHLFVSYSSQDNAGMIATPVREFASATLDQRPHRTQGYL